MVPTRISVEPQAVQEQTITSPEVLRANRPKYNRRNSSLIDALMHFMGRGNQVFGEDWKAQTDESCEPITVERSSSNKLFAIIGLSAQVVLIIMFAILAKGDFNELSAEESLHEVQLYNNYIGVSLMMLVGFGYLMTFLHYYGLSALGLTMLVTCLSVQVSMLVGPAFSDGLNKKINIDVMSMLDGNFAAASSLISFGGVIGKLNPTQILVMTILEPIFYNMNKVFVLTDWLSIVDVGGTVIVHMFGTYYGLAIAMFLGRPEDTSREVSSTSSNLFSLIGTTVLWVFWPSFVAGAVPAGTPEAQTAITNTVLALMASTVTAVTLSPILGVSGLFRPVDLQNATLAGGVAIGAVADLNITPAGALLIGLLGGAVSTFGYTQVQAFLIRKIGLHDTCGIHNLHGMPSVLGGFISAIVPLVIDDDNAGDPGEQIAGMVLTIIVAISSGFFTACVLKMVKNDSRNTDDSCHWEVADDFNKAL